MSNSKFTYVEIPKIEMTLPELLKAVGERRVAVTDFPNGFGPLRELVRVVGDDHGTD